MRAARAIAGSWAALLSAAGLLAAGVVVAYLTEHGPRRFGVAAGLAAVGAVAATAIGGALWRHRRVRWLRIAAVSAMVVAVAVPVASVLYGRVSHARFGLTVYGLLPIPTLDITVGPLGLMWFRDKSHLVTATEVASLLSPEVDMVIIGTGWHGAVSVADELEESSDVEVVSLPTGEAIRHFNEARAAGRRPVLVVHSTC